MISARNDLLARSSRHRCISVARVQISAEEFASEWTAKLAYLKILVGKVGQNFTPVHDLRVWRFHASSKFHDKFFLKIARMYGKVK